GRRARGERRAAAATAQHEVAVAQANDEIEVAAPILLKSAALRDVELIEIIRHRSLEHQLTIAMRRAVSEPVAEALVETGSVDVIKTLLENGSARIAEATMAYLVDQSKTVDSFQEPILRRHDLSAKLAHKMYYWVSAALRQHIIENYEVQIDRLDDTIEAVAKQTVAELRFNGDTPSPEAPVELARRLAEANKITTQLLLQSLRQGEV